MCTLSKYQIFFILRDKYPQHCKLIAALMNYAFQNNDSFNHMTYLNGTFDEKDIKFIFEELNLQIVSKVLHSNVRSNPCTIVELTVDIQSLEFAK